MAPLIILVAAFVLILAANKFVFGGRLSISQIGRYALASMMLIAGISHFTTTGVEVMTQMMPDAIPYKRELVYFTGVCELAAVPGLILQRTSRLTAIMLIIFFLAVLPANIAGSLKQVNYSAWNTAPCIYFFACRCKCYSSGGRGISDYERTKRSPLNGRYL